MGIRIMVVDGQGGGIGKAVIERIRKERLELKILAVGANAVATGSMIRAGASDFATGENPVVFNSGRMDVIIGSVGIIAANAMQGEITPKMAAAIASSQAFKILIPINKCDLKVVGSLHMSLSDKIESAHEILVTLLSQMNNNNGEGRLE